MRRPSGWVRAGRVGIRERRSQRRQQILGLSVDAIA